MMRSPVPEGRPFTDASLLDGSSEEVNAPQKTLPLSVRRALRNLLQHQLRSPRHLRPGAFRSGPRPLTISSGDDIFPRVSHRTRCAPKTVANSNSSRKTQPPIGRGFNGQRRPQRRQRAPIVAYATSKATDRTSKRATINVPAYHIRPGVTFLLWSF
ncbi:TonB-dependent receptor [Anopheles sinensis]|uniref:TonB-dependent receptor n=1 Tax=Anopheles sinensis TaxID=74873 RepID=A0A084WSD8_ANOSI|nr:TonB-dependent receptor [Anopheles sinensis]